MEKERNVSDFSDSYGKQAENILKKRYAIELLPLSDTETNKICYDLELQKIELELLKNKVDLAEGNISDDDCNNLHYQNINPRLNNICYLILNFEGIITDISFSALKLLNANLHEIIKTNFKDLVLADFQNEFSNFLNAIYQKKSVENCRLELNIKTNDTLQIIVQGIFLSDEIRCIIMLYDIDWLKKLQNTDTYSLQQYKLIADSSYDWEFWQSPDGTYLYHSPSCQRITGYDPVFFGSDPEKVYAIIHPEDLDSYLIHDCDCRKKNKPSHLEFRIITSEGKTKWIKQVCLPVFDTSGEYLGLRGSNRDNGEFCYIFKHFKENEFMFKAIIENSSDTFSLIDANGKVLYNSPSYHKIMGYPEKQRIAQNTFELVHSEDLPTLMKIFSGLLDNTKLVSIPPTRVLHSSNSWIWIEGTAHNLLNEPGIKAIVVNFRNITDRIKAEEDLKKSEENYRLLAENIEDVIWKFDLGTQRFTYVSPSIYKLRGYTSEEAVKQTLEEWLMPGSLKAVYSELPEIIKRFEEEPQESLATRKYELQVRHKDGHPVWVEIVRAFILGTDGHVAEVIASTRDITERKNAESDLQKSEVKYKNIIENLTDVYYRTDSEGRLIMASPSCLETFGYSSMDEVIGQKIDILYQKENERAEFIEMISKTGKVKNYRTVLLRQDGTELFVETTANILKDSNGDYLGVEGIVRDITDRKTAELALLERESKLREINATKDKLFSIIGHDLKSPFTCILGFSELLANNLRSYSYDESKEFIQHINTAAKNTLTLLDNLLAWAKAQTGQMIFKPVVFNLHAVIEEIITVFELSARLKGIALVNDQTTNFQLYADQNMVQTILRNLISNAIKFTNPGGRVHIYSLKTGNVIKITVEDNGIGINNETLNKLFNIEKSIIHKGTAQEKGSGLGLILCKDFVEKHGGKIWAESEAAVGSKFIFTLREMFEDVNEY